MQGYNPDYSGLLGAGAMQANALSQLGQAGGNLIAQQRQKRAKDELMGRAREAISTGDPAVISELMIKNPELAGSVQNAINFQSDATKKNLVDSIEGILANPTNAEQILESRVAQLTESGADPSQTLAALQEYKDNPKGLLRNAEILYAINAPEKSKAYQAAKSAGAPEKMTEYQRATIEGKKVDQELRRLEIEEKKIDRQLRRETDQLKKQELEQNLDQTKSEKTKLADADKTKINEGIYQAEQNKRAINDLLGNDDYMDSITGYRGRLPTATTTGVEAEAYLDNIRNSMTIDNLGVMSGPLTDKDIQIIASASSRLRPGMSRSALEKELKTINSAYDRVIGNYKKEANRKGYESPTEAKTVNWSDL